MGAGQRAGGNIEEQFRDELIGLRKLSATRCACWIFESRLNGYIRWRELGTAK